MTTPTPQPAAELTDPTNTLEWLASHCRAIGMTKKSDSGLLAHDIALFTADLQAASPRPQALPELPEPVSSIGHGPVMNFTQVLPALRLLPFGKYDLFTADQMRTYGLACMKGQQ